MMNNIKSKIISVFKGVTSGEDKEKLVAQCSMPMSNLDCMLDCISDETNVVLIGEATHGSQEFYQIRSELTKRLLSEKGFNIVAMEADFPDCYHVNSYVTSASGDALSSLEKFKRFPRWLMRNYVVLDFVKWLRNYNEEAKLLMKDDKNLITFYGIDLYSLQSSREAVLDYLENIDLGLAAEVKRHYSCFDRFGVIGKRNIIDTDKYSYQTGLGLSKSCQEQVLAVLRELIEHQAELTKQSPGSAYSYFYGLQNAKIVKNAELYYRSMMSDDKLNVNTWNIRDRHMVDTLNDILVHMSQQTGKPQKAIVWAHNSHIGDNTYTDFNQYGEVNIGQLARERFGMAHVFSIGFTTYNGTVTAAEKWGDDPEIMKLNPAVEGSYEKLFHDSLKQIAKRNGASNDSFALIFRSNTRKGEEYISPALVEVVSNRLLERAVGVVYKPNNELNSHYFKGCLPKQFDAVIHIDRTSALEPLEVHPQWARGNVDYAPSAFPGLAQPKLTLSKREMYEDGYFDPNVYDPSDNCVNQEYLRMQKESDNHSM